MKRVDRILIGAGCLLLLVISWLVVINSKSPAERQLDLMRQAARLIDDGIFIRAVPILEEAAGYNTAYTLTAEAELKSVYLALIDQSGFRRRYTGLLEKQMGRKDAQASIFAEAAGFYLSVSRITDALTVLRTGIERTGSGELAELYEKNRYAFETNRTSYEYVSAIHGATVQVRTGGLWGIAGADGVLMIPCEYERISTFSADRAIARKNDEIFAVDRNNNRIALLHEGAEDFGNYAENRIPLLIGGNWLRATGEFTLGTILFEMIGTYSEGSAAAKVNGKWGVIDMSSNWIVPAEFDGIIQDELGRCYAQGAVFVRKDGAVYLFTGGRQADGSFEDARPFSAEGFAAVKRNGKWGFIDVNGTNMIDYLYDDALSFGQHLAAVKSGEYWGYVSMLGHVVIEPAFLEAKSFSNGSAPVLTQRGWQFITLLEYKKGASL